ncbi:MAG: acyl-CoA dehydrogenase family protein [Pseudomonadota bacterium]
MAGFGFSEEQEMFRDSIKKFAQKELAPGADERARGHELPREYMYRLREIGLLGICVPEEYGGYGGDWVSMGIAVEEMSKVDPGVGNSMVFPALGALCLQQADEELKKEWIPKLVTGEKLNCFAVTEPGAGSDAGAIRTTAVRDGDYYVINGEKSPISIATHADVAILFAKTDPKAGALGVTCFWVPMELEGISRHTVAHTGLKSGACASIFYDNVRVHKKYRVGEEGKGFYIFASSGADYLRVCLAMMGLGMAQSALQLTMDYVKQRHAFGQPIAKFEGVSAKIAEHATLIEAARLLCYRALWLKDQGLKHTKESAMCKWWCPEVAFNAIRDCIVLHGHVGYSEELILEQRLRDTLGLYFADGTPQIMKIIVARELMGRVAVPY